MGGIPSCRSGRSVGWKVSRSSFHDAPQGETALNLDLMLKVDKQFLDTRFMVSGR